MPYKNIPDLFEIEVEKYPRTVSDWRAGDAPEYNYSGKDPARWAWEFLRRRRDFQLLTDIKYATHNAFENSCSYTEGDPESERILAEHQKRAFEIRKLRMPVPLVNELKQYKEFEEQLSDVKKRGIYSEGHSLLLGFSHVVSRLVLLRLFPQFKESAGWRSASPLHDIPGMETPEVLDPNVHSGDTPPWPVSWFGDELVPDDEFQMDIAYMRIPVKVASYSGTKWPPDLLNARAIIIALAVATLAMLTQRAVDA